MSRRRARLLRVLACVASGLCWAFAVAWWRWSVLGGEVGAGWVGGSLLLGSLLAVLAVRRVSGTWPWQDQLGTPSTKEQGA